LRPGDVSSGLLNLLTTECEFDIAMRASLR
jgi:hypothetical protein